MLGFNIEASSLTIRLPEDRADGARVLFDRLREKAYSKVPKVNNPQQVRCQVAHYRTSNSMWCLVGGPVDTLLLYTDDCAIWVNCPLLEARQAFRGRKTIISTCMRKDGHRAKYSQGCLLASPNRYVACLYIWIVSRLHAQPETFPGVVSFHVGFHGGLLMWRSRILPLPPR